MVQETDPKDEHEQSIESDPPAGSEVKSSLPSRVRAHRKQPREEWREEFPYPWEEDDLVTRRDTLRFLAAGSGALFLATGVLAIIGNLSAAPTVQAVPVAKVGELAENEWRVFNFPDQYNQGILINLPGRGLVAYSDVCTHLSCAVLYQNDGKLHCPCHDGLFDATTGNVLAGPPTRPLPLIRLAIHNGTIYAVKLVPR
jgi:Rieske Fe-S protein